MSVLVKSFIMSGHFDLALLAESLPHMIISQRKLLLTFTRIQNASNYRFKAALYALECSGEDTFVYRDTVCKLGDVIDNLEKYRFQPLSLGLISMMIRTVYHEDLNELEMAVQQSFDKEFLAATTPTPEPTFDFSCFLSEDVLDRDNPLTSCHQPSPHMGYKLHIGLALLRDRMMRDQPLIPSYSRSKNCSRSMAKSFNRYSNSTLRDSEVRTLDVLMLYARTGIRCDGWTEMRSVFRFTDLAPRAYYSTGGSAYWAANYMKKFCYELTTVLPTCSPKDHIRSDISRLHYRPGNTVLLYDYSSFTSSLPGMSQFIMGLAGFFRGCFFKVFDPFEGNLELDVGQMLEDYDIAITRDLRIDIDRLVPVNPEDGMGSSFYMANNGPLGAQGNINLSMLLHAINITAAQDHLDMQNCVGDDAIVVFDEDRYSRGYFIRIINLLGSVNESKTIWMKALKHETSLQRENAGWQFMKRPIVVYWEYIWTGNLIDFPNTSIWERPDNIHVNRLEGMRIAEVFVGQVSSFFDDCFTHSTDLKGEEMELSLILLENLYQRLHFPPKGSFPGRYLNLERFQIIGNLKYAIPALDLKNFEDNWRRVMWDGIDNVDGFVDVEREYNQRMMRVSYDWCECTKSKVMSVLSDFGFGEMKLKRRWYERTPEDRELWLDAERRIPIYMFRMTSDLPTPFVNLLRAYNLDITVDSTFDDSNDTVA